MPTRTREHTVAIDDPSAGGLYESLESGAQISNLVIFRGSDEYMGWRFAKSAAPGSANQLEQVAPPNAVKVSIYATSDAPPTAGTFTVRIDKSASNGTTTALAFNVADSAFATAFAAALTTATVSQTATVAKDGVDYVATFQVGVTGITAMTGDSALLSPECSVFCKRIQTGTSTLPEKWRISVSQKGLAFAVPTVAYPALTSPVGASTTVAGTGTQHAIQTLTLSPAPYGGSGSWTFTIRQLVRMTLTAPDVAGSLSGQIVATFKSPGVGPGDDVQIDLYNGSGSTASAPGSGTQITVSYEDNATAAELAQLIYDALNGAGTIIAALDLNGAAMTVTSQVAGYTNGAIGATLSRTREARTLSAVLPWDVTADAIETASGGLYTVTSEYLGKYVLTCTENGAQTSVSVVTTNLVVPIGLEGTLYTDTEAAIQAFAATTEDEIACIYEIEATESGGSPRTILQVPCTEKRDNIRTA